MLCILKILGHIKKVKQCHIYPMVSNIKFKQMKKTIFILGILFLSFSSASAQGNLEFNRVIKENYPLSAGTNGNETIIVPEGKVWKVTSATIGAIRTNGTISYPPTARIDGHLVAYVSSDSINNLHISPFPLWLPAGTYSLTYYGGESDGAIAFSYSGIEFNIVP
jgi:hypothetical protein